MTPLDPATKSLLIRTRDVLAPALVGGMPGAGLDYKAAGDLLVDIGAALDEPESES